MTLAVFIKPWSIPSRVSAELAKAHQLSLFDEVVNVPGSVKQDGTVVKPYTRVQKKRKPEPTMGSNHGMELPIPETKPPIPAKQPPVATKEPERATEAPQHETPSAKPKPMNRRQLRAHVEDLQDAKVSAEREVDRREYRKLPPDPELNRKMAEATAAWEAAVAEENDRFPMGTGRVYHRKDAGTNTLRTPVETIKIVGKEIQGGPSNRAIDQAEKSVRRIEEKHPDEHVRFGAQGESKAERRRINQDVVTLLGLGKTEYTAAEKALMAKYSGNGGCGDSLNEYYTDPKVAEAMWTALRNLGFKGGTALEPSCGTGVFLQTAPPDVKVTGVEIDPISARVAHVLHGNRHEIAQNSLELFANNDDRQFDVVIGNAPFGDRGATIRDDKPDIARADTYFIDTALDKAAPGGLVAMIVNHGTMDSGRDEAMRLRFLTRGQFIGALRMPNTAFEHSHTNVTADIWFFRKKSNEVAGALSTLSREQLNEAGQTDETYLKGRYFESPLARENILGTIEPGWRAKAGMGDDITVAGSMEGIPAAIAKFGSAVPHTSMIEMPELMAHLRAHTDDKTVKRALGASMARPYEKKRRGDTRTVDGIQYILEGEPLRWHRVDEFMAQQSITDAADVAGDIDKLMTGRGVDRPKLEQRIRDYVAKHGHPSKNKLLEQAAHQDQKLYRLIGAVRPDGTLSDAVTGKSAKVVVGSLETAAQTLMAENEGGLFTAEQAAERTGKATEQIEDELMASPDYAYAGNGQWSTMAAYLTGELWPKLDFVKSEEARGDLRPGVAEKYAMQARKLDEAIDPLSLEDVDIAVNSGFIPLDILSEYFTEQANKFGKGGERVKISLRNSVFYIEGGGYFYGKNLLDQYLNRTGVKEKDIASIEQMNADFKAWLLTSKYRDQVEDVYNRSFRGFVNRDFSNQPFEIPGMNTEGLKDFQYGGVRWALANKRGIIAADVGLGKTVRALMLARLAKINGQAKRPVFVVPKSVLSNWVKEAEKWFPGSKVLVIGESIGIKGKPKADSEADRNRKLHDMTQNDYDFVFVSQPAWNTIDLNPELKDRYSEDDFWEQRKTQLEGAADKRIKGAKTSHDQKIAAADFQNRSDAADFDKLGIDMLIMDEAHAYKNLFGARNRFGSKPKFLGGGAMSKRSIDTRFKTRWLREQNGGNNVYFLTATPSKNSPLEIFSMLSYTCPDLFDRVGIKNSEEFIDRFCEFKTGLILGVDGKIDDALYTSGFKNMDELREIMRRGIDRKTAADVGLKLPAREDFEHVLPMTAQQQAVYADLRAQIENADSSAGGESHIFSVMSRMGKAALDLELLDKAYAGSESPKFNEVAKIASENSKEGGQIIFCESIESHDKIKASLVKAGVKPDEIAIFNAGTVPSSEERQNIQDEFNAGRLKVVIGNKTMEEGVNLQKFTADIHHLDTPWDPSTLQQRNGRGLRQGNTRAGIRIHSYHSAGTFDGYRYQTVMAKKDWQELLWNGGNRIENLATPNVPSRDEMLVMLSADPDAERIKMAENRSAAEAAYKAKKTEEASLDFMRFQSFKANLERKRNKDDDSGRRLKANITKLHARLSADPHFPHKEALNFDTPVLIHPSTGTIIREGLGFKIKGDQFVVTGVDTKDNEVTIRPYAQVAGNRERTIKLTELDHDTAPFDYDQGIESAELEKQAEADAGAKLRESISYKDVIQLHPKVIEKHYKHLQDKMRQSAKDYTLSHYGDFAMVNPAGNVVSVSHYDTKSKDDHDFVLPIPEHREKMMRAYADAERSKSFHAETQTHNKRRNYGFHRGPMRQRYGSSIGGIENPIGQSGQSVFGVSFKDEAHQAFEREQHQKMQDAQSFEDAMRAAAPTIQAGYDGVKWPKKTLSILFAVAKRTGSLDRSISDMMPKAEKQYGYQPELVPRRMFEIKSSSGNTASGVHDATAGDALQRLAIANKHYDLAAAIAIQSHPPAAALSQILDMPLSGEAVVDSIRHLVEKNPSLGNRPLSDFMTDYAIRSKIGYVRDGMNLAELPDALQEAA